MNQDSLYNSTENFSQYLFFFLNKYVSEIRILSREFISFINYICPTFANFLPYLDISTKYEYFIAEMETSLRLLQEDMPGFRSKYHFAKISPVMHGFNQTIATEGRVIETKMKKVCQNNKIEMTHFISQKMELYKECLLLLFNTLRELMYAKNMQTIQIFVNNKISSPIHFLNIFSLFISKIHSIFLAKS
jgi:hypothetical protein